MKLYINRKKSGIEATCDYNPTDGTFVVLKGSKVSAEIAHSEKFRGAGSIEKARAGVVRNQIVTKDVVFKSASTSANFVTGASTNGLEAWKDENGVSLKELRK